MKMTGAEFTIKMLENYGIKYISGIPGGANLPLYDALSRSSIKHILARHEQGAGFIAQGMARSTGKPGICFATSGPGATNLFTAIADAYLDSIPIIGITGQVPSQLIGTDAFQEVDVYGMSLPITKHNFLVKSTEELKDAIPEAFKIALSGRPGPVLIDIPKDIQKEEMDIEDFPIFMNPEHSNSLDQSKLDLITNKINNSKKPLLLFGGGLIHADADEELLAFIEKSSIPAASTLMGLGCVPSSHPLFMGMIGMHGSAPVNYILKDIDLLIACGMRFGDRTTGKVKQFCPNAEIIHIDIDASEFNKIKDTDISFQADIKKLLINLNENIKSNDRLDWLEEVKTIESKFLHLENKSNDQFDPINIIKNIGAIAQDDAIISTDVGQHQMWTAQYFPFKSPRTFLTSGGLGTMGFGLPAAIGAGLEYPEKQIICISGDGSILMNIQELATLYELDLNITIIILNNGHLGLVRQQQEYFFEKKYFASKFEFNPDFAHIASGFGISGYDLKDSKDLKADISKIMNAKGPKLINIPIHWNENVLPMVPPGAANHEMIGGEYNE